MSTTCLKHRCLSRSWLARGAITVIFLASVMWPRGTAAGPEVALLDRPAACPGHAMTVATAVSLSPADASGNRAGYLMQAGFDATASSWDGKLGRLEFRFSPTDDIASAARPAWEAGAGLTDLAPDDRRIVTMTDAGASPGATIEFRWGALSPAQQAALNASPADGEPDGLGERRLHYLRGSREAETDRPGGMFRIRRTLFGDVDWSIPVLVEASYHAQNSRSHHPLPDGARAGQTTVYIGANDGMLHAFDADNGKELFAYLPRALLPHLNRLTSPQAVHRPYADGQAVTADAQSNGQWMTVLAAGMGGGARGVFALDISDPAHFLQGAGALWEFTDADDKHMGYLTGRPRIAKFRVANAGGETGFRYFVVVPSGLGDTSAGSATSALGTASASSLFLLALDKPRNEAWRAGSNYFRFEIPETAAGPNTLTTPALVPDGDGAISHAYAGDLQGNLWRFDFMGAIPWPVTPGRPKRLFTARDAKDIAQPISMRPSVAHAPGSGFLILFGTGKYLAAADARPGASGIQSFYAIHDSLADDYTVQGRNDLAVRTLVRDGAAAYRIAGNAFTYGGGKSDARGWYVDFDDAGQTGERVVSDASLHSGFLIFHSLIPASDLCAPAAGRNYVLDVLTGMPASARSTGVALSPGMSMQPVILDTAAGVRSVSPIGRRTETRRLTVLGAGPGGVRQIDTIDIVRHAGRLSWREILNWQELRHDAIKHE